MCAASTPGRSLRSGFGSPATVAVLYAWGARAVLATALVGAIVAAAPNTGPLALAEWLARTIHARGLPPGPASLGWLGALIASRLSSVGPLAVAAATAVFALGALALVEVRARAFTPGRFALLAAPLAALCALDALRPGGGTGSWLAAAFVLLVLDDPSPRNLAVLAGTTALWCNLEPEGLLAPAAAFAVALGATLDAAGSRAAGTATAGTVGLWRSWLAALVATVAAGCTPAGAGFGTAAFAALRFGDAARGIVATAPAQTAPHAYPIALFTLFVLALAGGLRVRGLRNAVPIALAFVLALANGALLPLFGILAAPALVAGLRRLAPERERTLWPAPLAATVVAIAVVLAVRAAPPPDGAFALARSEAAAHARGVLFCSNVNWCDVALAGGERVLFDGRLAAYGAAARTSQRKIAGLEPGWKTRLRQSGATAALVPGDGALATLLGLQPAWRIAARSGTAALFERVAP